MNRQFLTAALLVSASTASIATAQQRPPIRQLGAITAKSAEQFTMVTNIRALSNGAVLVNEPGARRVLLFDPQLSKFTVVADSTSATANAYGVRPGSLIAYRGDSSIFVDPNSVSMLIIDPAGKVSRVVAIPRAEDANTMGSLVGNTAYDGKGNLIYRSGFRFGGPGQQRIVTGGGAGGAARIPQIPEPPDSAFVVRVNLATRKLDTLGVIKTPKIKMEVKTDENGGFSMTSLVNPLPVIDEWVMTSDGAIAFVRGRDYHVDWVNPDGTKVSSAKIPFEWQRLTDEDKVAFIDSVKAARERQGNLGAVNVTGPLGGGGGGPNISINVNPGGGPGAREGATRTLAQAAQAQFNFIPPNELPDYKPPFFAGAVRADMEGNVWVRTIPTAAIAGGPVYDVINRKGELVERVQIPVGRTIAGFGPNGAVYLVNREGTTATLEKASVR